MKQEPKFICNRIADKTCTHTTACCAHRIPHVIEEGMTCTKHPHECRFSGRPGGMRAVAGTSPGPGSRGDPETAAGHHPPANPCSDRWYTKTYGNPHGYFFG